LELFLNRLGRRVYFKEVGGLFSKRAGLKRYLQIRAIGSRSDGSDWIGPRSNRDRWNRIEGPWEFGRVGRRRDSPESISRGGGSPGLANPSLQGSIRPGFGSGADFAIHVIHPGLLLGSGMAGAACAALVAVLRGGARRREALRGFQGLRPIQTNAKTTEGLWGCLPRVGTGWCGRAGRTATTSSGGSRAALAEVAAEGVRRAC